MINIQDIFRIYLCVIYHKNDDTAMKICVCCVVESVYTFFVSMQSIESIGFNIDIILFSSV